jgi:spore maturation protein CgeB
VKLLIVGFSGSGHVGGYFASACRKLGIDYDLFDANRAEAKTRIGRSFYWRFRDKAPARLQRFGTLVLDAYKSKRWDVVLTTGRAPLGRSHIEKLRGQGIKVYNYSTDDPWNPSLQAQWFLSALAAYDAIFTPRRANIEDFRSCGVQTVHYLPFAYEPEVHRPWPVSAPAGIPSDVLFVGGCDRDRLPLIEALIESGLKMALFGGYWDKYPATRPHWRGNTDQPAIRSASAAARVCLCLVRRANRDGHVMRSYEAAAIGGCILAEDTVDHREIFGGDDETVRYFKSTSEMVQQAQFLVADSEARCRLSAQLRTRFVASKNTYADRLAKILQLVNIHSAS